MNVYGIIILVAIVAEYILNLIADVLNLRTLSAELPVEFRDVYDSESYQKSQQYARVRLKFGLLTSTLGTAAILVFWLAGGFGELDQLVRGWHLPPLWTGLVYIGILVALRSILSLPFSIYSTFVIEERFGFNRTTPTTFILDILKSVLLAVLLGGPLLIAVLAFFQYAGAMAWLYCWMVATGFILVVQFVAPTWIMPLFNKFTPLPEGELRQSIFDYAKSVNFSLRDIFVMDGSKRSSKSNAFFTGFGRNKRIALFDTLVNQHTVRELVAVLAHEIGHYKKKHLVQGIVISVAHAGVLFFLLSLFVSQKKLFDAFFVGQPSVYVGLVLFGFLYTPIEFVVSLALQAISRKHEYEADRFAAATTHQPAAMIDALKKLSRDNLSHLTPHPFYVALNYSHPPTVKRIRALKFLSEP